MRHLLLLLAFLNFPFAAVAQDTEGKGYLTNLIQDNLSGDDRIVDIQGFEGALSSRATVDKITVADSEGIWLTLEKVVLDWNRSALLRRKIDIQELTAERVIVDRAPVSSSNVPSPEAQPFSLPELPVSINLDTLNIARIELGESFLGEPVALSLEGTAQLAAGEGSANVTANRLDGKSGVFRIDGSYDNATKTLGLDVALEEGKDGIAARLLNLPGRPSVALTVAGTAPISEYAANLTIATDGQERITGDFAVNSTTGETGFALNVGGDLTPLLAPDYQGFFGPDVSLIAAGSIAQTGAFSLTTLDLTAQSLVLNGQVNVGPSGWPESIDLTGSIRNPGGQPVLLPLGGPKTYVDNVDLAIKYDETVSNKWTGTFDIAGFDRPGLGIAKIALTGGGIILNGNGPEKGEVTVDMTYAANGLQLDSAGAAQAFGDALDGQIVISRVEGEPTKISTLTLNGPGIEVAADATIQGPKDGLKTQTNIVFSADALGRFSTLAGRNLGGAAEATVVATVSPLDGMFDVLLNATTRDLAVDIPQLDPVLAGTGEVSLQAVRDTTGTRVNNLRLSTPEATVTADADITSGVSTGQFDASLRNVGLVVAGLDGPAQVRGTADSDDQGNVNFDVTGSGPATTFSAKGAVNASDEGQTVNATVNAAITDLSVYNTISKQDLAGAADVTVNAVLLSDMTRYSAQIDASTQDLQTGYSQVDPLLRGSGTVSGEVGYIGKGRYRISGLDVQTPQLSLTADADGGMTGPLTANTNLRISDIGLVADGLSGPLTIALNAVRDDGGSADVTLTAMGPDTNIAADVTIAPPEQNYRISGKIDAAVAELAPYAALANQTVSGGINAAVDGTLLPDLSLFDVTINGTTRSIAIGTPQIDQFLAGAGRINGGVARTGPDSFTLTNLDVATPQFSVQGSANGGLTGPLGADINAMINDAGSLAQGLNGPLTIALTANRNDAGTAQVNLTANGTGTNVKLDAQVAPQEDDYRITGTVNAQIANLSQFAALAGQPISGGLTVNAQGTLLPNLSSLDAKLNASTSNLAIGNPQVDQLLRGTGTLALDAAKSGNDITVRSFDAQFPQVSATGALTAADSGATRGTINARLADIGLFTDALSGPVTAQGQIGRTAAGSYSLDINATGPGGIAATASGQIAANGNMDVTVAGNAPLGLANPFLEPRRLDGIANFNLAVNGPPALSSVTGQVSTNGARLAAPTLSQALTDINGTIALNRGQAQIDLAGNVQSGGGIVVAGPVTLSAPYNGNLTLNVNAVELRDPNLYETVVNGQITVNGPLAGGAEIAGRLELGKTNIQVPSSGTSGLGDLPEVTHLNASAPVRLTLNRADVALNASSAPAQVAASSGPAYPLNIRVDAPNQIFIRGRGLDAELGGSLTLGGTTTNIVPVGQFDLQRGRISILQQRFDLTEGSASLQGDFIPYIRLVATTQSETGTMINIIVEGPANDPQVTFQSTPDLPQDEVLAQLIFGRDISQISPFQAVQLAAAVATLAGRGGGGLIDNFRSGIGLDDFDLTTDENGNAAVRAGKYLTDNIYTDVTIGSDGTTEINLNLDITDEITAKGTAGASGDTSIGIYFERDY